MTHRHPLKTTPPSLCWIFLTGLFALTIGCNIPVPARCDLSSIQIDNMHGHPFINDTGSFMTQSSFGTIDTTGEFFRDLGTNGRRCVSCHVPSQGWTINPPYLRRLFDQTSGGACSDGRGLAAVFRPVDGATSPQADVSSLEARRKAYTLLLTRGLVRIDLPIPADAEFELASVDDPYGFANSSHLSLFRRPLPTTNLKFDSTVMWDGREVAPGKTVLADLAAQANTATMVHAQGAPLSEHQREAIASFVVTLATAQSFDRIAGDLSGDGAHGGPAQILGQPFYLGINDNFGDTFTGAPFTPLVFQLYDAWGTLTDTSTQAVARRAIAHGQAIFNTRPIHIRGVSGINDEAVFGKPDVLIGTCTTCHTTPNGGSHSIVAPVNIGIVDASRRSADLPLYTLRNKATGQTVQVTDPGRAVIDGKWAHIGRFKGPTLRDLSVRAPYFHDGSAKDLDAVVGFYEGRFTLELSEEERRDLVAFLRAL